MAWWKHHQNTPVLAEKLEPGGLRRKLRHLAQLLLVNQNGDGGPGPRREWGPGPPQIAAPVGGRGAGCPPYGGGLAARERPSRRSRTYPPTPEREARQARPPRPQGRFKRVAIRDGRLSDYDDCRVKSRGCSMMAVNAGTSPNPNATGQAGSAPTRSGPRSRDLGDPSRHAKDNSGGATASRSAAPLGGRIRFRDRFGSASTTALTGCARGGNGCRRDLAL